MCDYYERLLVKEGPPVGAAKIPNVAPTTSHRQILKASSIIGGTSVVTILVGILRTKALAVLLGPAGVGLGGMYSTIMGTAGALASLGMGSSGVRQLAEAIGRGDERAVGISRTVLWYASLLSGFLGAGLLWMMREPVALWVLDDASEANAVGWLGVGLLLGAVAGPQAALLQGYRRIGDLARLNILGAVVGSLIAVAFVYALGRDGVLWFVLVNPAANVLIAWHYAARLPRPACRPTGLEVRREFRALLGLGFVFMCTGLMQSGTQLGLRTLLTHELGLESVGQFQAAWAISMQYITFVLGAMAADYYPRLTASIHDRELANRLVNEQAEVALLLAGPVILAMLTFAPLVIDALYADSFHPAADTLRWQVMGDLVKVFSWPIGFILLARGAGRLFFWTELSWHLAYLGLVFVSLPFLGLAATGVGFLWAYVLLAAILSLVVRRLNGFRWSRRNLRLLTGLSLAALAVQASAHLAPILDVATRAASTLSFEVQAFPPLGWLSAFLQSTSSALAALHAALSSNGSANQLCYSFGAALAFSFAVGSMMRLYRVADIRRLFGQISHRTTTRKAA